MNIDIIREFCLRLPGATEMIQWETALLFKVGGKIFVIYSLSEGTNNILSLKCSPEKFREMIECEGIIPAPYLARNNWICLQKANRLKLSELKGLIRDSYKIVSEKLPKKIKEQIKLQVKKN